MRKDALYELVKLALCGVHDSLEVGILSGIKVFY